MIKNNLMISLIVIFFSGLQIHAASVTQDLDTLGANRKLIKKAKRYKPENKVRIVQKRAVDRDLRFETFIGYGWINGGNSYLNSNQLELNVDFHINPKFSVGARYFRFENELTSEAKRVYGQAQAYDIVPDVRDFANSAWLGTLSWYPLYGKINFFDSRVVQFDLYTLGGVGQVSLNQSGDSTIYTLGGGAGFWISNRMSARMEVRYQSYEDQIGLNQTRQLDQTVFTLMMGVLL